MALMIRLDQRTTGFPSRGRHSQGPYTQVFGCSGDCSRQPVCLAAVICIRGPSPFKWRKEQGFMERQPIMSGAMVKVTVSAGAWLAAGALLLSTAYAQGPMGAKINVTPLASYTG